jgi:hypothetical protein
LSFTLPFRISLQTRSAAVCQPIHYIDYLGEKQQQPDLTVPL